MHLTHSTPADNTKDTEIGKENTHADTDTEMTVKYVLVSSIHGDKRDGGG